MLVAARTFRSFSAGGGGTTIAEPATWAERGTGSEGDYLEFNGVLYRYKVGGDWLRAEIYNNTAVVGAHIVGTEDSKADWEAVGFTVTEVSGTPTYSATGGRAKVDVTGGVDFKAYVSGFDTSDYGYFQGYVTFSSIGASGFSYPANFTEATGSKSYRGGRKESGTGAHQFWANQVTTVGQLGFTGQSSKTGTTESWVEVYYREGGGIELWVDWEPVETQLRANCSTTSTTDVYGVGIWNDFAVEFKTCTWGTYTP